MKRYMFASFIAIILLVLQVRPLEYFKQIQQGASATSESINAIKNTIDGVAGLVGTIDASVTNIGQKVAQLTRTANGIVTDNPQESIKNSFGTINNSLDVSMELLPAIQELTKVLSLIGNGILPTLSKFPGAGSIAGDVANVSSTITNITSEVGRIKQTLDQWLPKIKQLSTNLGQHAVDMAVQIEGTIADVKKVGF